MTKAVRAAYQLFVPNVARGAQARLVSLLVLFRSLMLLSTKMQEFTCFAHHLACQRY